MFHHAVLPNGLEIIAERNPAALSVALGFFVRTGARDETPELSGVSHFLEHMAFKGDAQYTADDLNRLFDEIGAKYNASTSEEVTCYYAAVLPEYLPTVFPLLAGLLQPSLRETDFELEKQVILEEIGMYQDMPGFYLYEQAMAAHFADHPLGQSILGSQESIRALQVGQMQAYFREQYRAGNILLAATGLFDWEELLDLARQHCGGWPPGQPVRPEVLRTPRQLSRSLIREELNQQHWMELATAPAGESSFRAAAELSAFILGDEQAGRLYWELVDTGAAESADVSYHEFAGAGVWSVYLCCSPEEIAENLAIVHAECERFNAAGPTADEVARARTKLASRIVLSSERPMGRLTMLAGNWMLGHGYRTVEAELAIVRELEVADVCRVLREFPIRLETSVSLGPLVLEGLAEAANQTSINT
jgi:predicted Zn-dependent peptidase